MTFGQHMRLRWWQRGERKEPNLNIAWEESHEVEIIGRNYHKARYHEDSNTLLLRRTKGGGTVIDGRYDTIIDNGVYRCAGCGDIKKRDMPCRECNPMVGDR